jgi:hypothetical protein
MRVLEQSLVSELVMNALETAVMKEKSAAIDERSVEDKIKWEIIFPNRGKIDFKMPGRLQSHAKQHGEARKSSPTEVFDSERFVVFCAR